MRGGQLTTVFVPAAAQLLHLVVLFLGVGGAIPRLGGGDLQPVHLLLRGDAAAVGRTDLLAEPGHPLGPGGGGPDAGRQPALDRTELRLGRGALGDRQGQHLAARGQPHGQRFGFFSQLIGLAVKLIGVTAGPLRLGRLGQQAVPLRG